jgi:hypothetical protein
MSTPADNLSARELADLSALADGTLEPARRGEVEARIAASPRLSELYERERRAVEILHESSSTVRAPAGLRARIEAERPRAVAGARRRVGFGGALAGAVAAATLALALILPAGTPGAPSVSQAAGLATRAPIGAVPTADPSTPTKLQTQVEDVYFPDWSKRFGWHATGERTDRINGRLAVTVFYEWRGARLAYTIVGSPPLKTPNAHFTIMHGTEYRALTLGNRLVVTWRRSGHTCVLSGTRVPVSELQRLAAWKTPSE